MANKKLLKMVVLAMMVALGVVISPILRVEGMCPMAHFINITCAALLGPWYACAAAFLCGVMRMMTGRTIQAVAGAVFGPILGGLLYRKTRNIWLVWVGEVIGTGILGALTSYPLMRMFYGLDVQNWAYYIPFYTPSAVVGGAMGVAVVLILKRTDLLRQMEERLLQEENVHEAV